MAPIKFEISHKVSRIIIYLLLTYFSIYGYLSLGLIVESYLKLEFTINEDLLKYIFYSEIIILFLLLKFVGDEKKGIATVSESKYDQKGFYTEYRIVINFSFFILITLFTVFGFSWWLHRTKEDYFSKTYEEDQAIINTNLICDWHLKQHIQKLSHKTELFKPHVDPDGINYIFLGWETTLENVRTGKASREYSDEYDDYDIETDDQGHSIQNFNGKTVHEKTSLKDGYLYYYRSQD